MTPTTYGRDFAYCLKSHGGVRGFNASLWRFLLRCTLFCHSVATFLTSVSSYEGGCGFEAMYEIEYFILCITIIVVLRFWDTNNLPIAIIMIIGLTFNIASVIYKSIVYKKNDIRNIIRKILILIVSIVYLVSIISYLNS